VPVRLPLLVALIVATLVGAAYLFRTDPSVTSIFGGCHFRAATGYYCPGCGGTRAMHALLHLRVGQAMGLNPMVFGAIGLFLILANVIARELVGAKYPIPNVEIPSWAGWSLGGLVFVFWLVRNIPAWPFTLLTP
jgi:hypothetical protein